MEAWEWSWGGAHSLVFVTVTLGGKLRNISELQFSHLWCGEIILISRG